MQNKTVKSNEKDEIWNTSKNVTAHETTEKKTQKDNDENYKW